MKHIQALDGKRYTVLYPDSMILAQSYGFQYRHLGGNTEIPRCYA